MRSRTGNRDSWPQDARARGADCSAAAGRAPHSTEPLRPRCFVITPGWALMRTAGSARHQVLRTCALLSSKSPAPVERQSCLHSAVDPCIVHLTQGALVPPACAAAASREPREAGDKPHARRYEASLRPSADSMAVIAGAFDERCAGTEGTARVRDAAATIIQRYARGALARKHYNARRVELRHEALTKRAIQLQGWLDVRSRPALTRARRTPR